MKTCPYCKAKKLGPCGRAHINMADGGLLEIIVLACIGCRKMSFEYPTLSSLKCPKPAEGEKIRDYLERTL